ncbi:MAG: 1-(5-phosphoribosyl)-5-[(5-phosphoribosylamino)methylideneamino] imidazole-4-carboxamide isomerase [Saprospiraceae bacterium]|nr:1-(5-phosphoribosyl)-5-[(5-phosphoribosylamino)methylideneamino] imidazole-4-carboxamide isomerase [Saprospiraceae bacterium]
MIIFPAIDLIGGKCVRLTEGDFNRMQEYSAEPIEMARQFEAAGLTHLHLVDLDGARNKKVTQHQVLEQICAHTHLIVDFGGGIKTKEDLKRVFDSGANQANIGSLAITEPGMFESWLEEYGAAKLIWAADVRDMKLAAHAWKDTSALHLFDMLDRFMEHGLLYLTCTDISKDGQLTGVNQELYQILIEKYPGLKITASGGVHNLEDLYRLETIDCYGAIVGKAIYENKIKIESLGLLSRV